MSIRVLQKPEPLSEAARMVAPVLAKSDASVLIRHELERYVDREVLGRSLLVSGHRGAGKTTLVLNAIQELGFQRSRSMPLLVRLQAPDLMSLAADAAEEAEDAKPEGQEKPPPPQDPPAEPSQETARDAAAETADPEAPGQPSDDRNEGEDKPAAAEDPAAINRILERITVAIYRSLAQVLGRTYTEHVVQKGLGSELAAQLRLALDEAPGPALLREFWRRADALSSGVLFARPPNPDQGLRELSALVPAAQAFRIVSGEFTQSEKRSDKGGLERTQETTIGAATKDLLGPLLGLFSGGAIAIGGITQGAQGAAAGVAAALTAVTITFAFQWTSKRSRKREVTQEYSFIRKRGVSTLERELPILIGRLHEAGLAPVFVVDELDKLDNLTKRMEGVVNHLKHFVTEGAFFCFLTDRNYFEHLRYLWLHAAYPREHTYFTHQVFVFFRPADLHSWFDQLLTIESEGPEDAGDKAVLPYMLMHRARMHMVDLHRELVKILDGDRVFLPPGEVRTDPGYVNEVTIQLAVELILSRPDNRAQLEKDPNFAQLLYDALYYPSRQLAAGMDKILDTSLEAFLEYMSLRMRRPGRNEQPASTSDDSENQNGNDKLPIGELNILHLHNQMTELVSLLCNPTELVSQLEASRLLPSTASTAPQMSFPVEAIEVIETTGPLLEPVGLPEPTQDQFAWRYDANGRRLPPVELPVEAGEPPPPAEDKREAPAEAAERERPPRAEPTEGPHPAFNDLDESRYRYLKSLNDLIYDLTKTLDLSRLANELHMVAGSPSWSQVREANERIERARVRNEPYETLDEDRERVKRYCRMLDEWAEVLTRGLQLGFRFSTAVELPSQGARISKGLDVVSEGLNLSQRARPAEIVQRLEKLADSLVQQPLAFIEPLTAATFDGWASKIRNAMKESENKVPRAEVEAAHHQAWASWRYRLRKHLVTGDERFDFDRDDLMCLAAEWTPSTVLKPTLANMTLRDWSALFLDAYKSQQEETSRCPRWILVVAWAKLGFGSRVDELMDQVSLLGVWKSFSEGDQIDMVNDWIAFLKMAPAKWREPQDSALLVVPNSGSPIEDWKPEEGYAAFVVRENEAGLAPFETEYVLVELSDQPMEEKEALLRSYDSPDHKVAAIRQRGVDAPRSFPSIVEPGDLRSAISQAKDLASPDQTKS